MLDYEGLDLFRVGAARVPVHDETQEWLLREADGTLTGLRAEARRFQTLEHHGQVGQVLVELPVVRQEVVHVNTKPRPRRVLERPTCTRRVEEVHEGGIDQPLEAGRRIP